MSNPDAITEELRSGDPDRVAHALTVLDRAWRTGVHVPLPIPAADCLEAFGDDLPEEIVDKFIGVMQSYVPFEPPPEPSGRHTTAVEAALLYGPGQPVFQVAMFIRIDETPDYVVKDVMRHVLLWPAETESELTVLEQLLGYLLDARSTHDATVDGLIGWAFSAGYPTVVDALLPQLDDAERKRVLDARGEDTD